MVSFPQGVDIHGWSDDPSVTATIHSAAGRQLENADGTLIITSGKSI